MQLLRVNATLQWVGTRTTMGFVAACRELKLTAEAETWSGLNATIAEILDDFFRARLQDGALDETLKQLGWPLSVAAAADASAVRFDVPFNVKVTASPEPPIEAKPESTPSPPSSDPNPAMKELERSLRDGNDFGKFKFR